MARPCGDGLPGARRRARSYPSGAGHRGARAGRARVRPAARLAYKAERAGLPVVYVDPAYTSQECSQCHHIDRKNRPTQARFTCRSCGIVLHADLNGSRTIAARGAVVWNAGRQSSVPETP
ncbi:zinc ribbon domain-containing protein [Mangrovactinospora gilvigrisea]|uniref:zinc ribbon domain-containing protein n=1 Tax=Mangrovactinospora gilvigrisea TaxID=1428644 RepID=UPI003AF3A483